MNVIQNEITVDETKSIGSDSAEEFIKNALGDLKGIAGWLILPAVEFIITPIVIALAFTEGKFSLVDGPFDVIVLSYMFFAAYHFFTKSRKTPDIMVRLYILEFIIWVVMFIVTSIALNIPAFDPWWGGVFIFLTFMGIRLAIWTSYWRVSKRVKATFVN